MIYGICVCCIVCTYTRLTAQRLFERRTPSAYDYNGPNRIIVGRYYCDVGEEEEVIAKTGPRNGGGAERIFRIEQYTRARPSLV